MFIEKDEKSNTADALRKAQKVFEGLAEKLGLKDEQDVVDMVKEIRRESGS